MQKTVTVKIFSEMRWESEPGDSEARFSCCALTLAHVYSDYIENQRLDRYDTGDLNDEEDFSDDPDARRAAEARMAARDRRAARGQTGAGERRKARMPAFLASEEEDSEDEGQLFDRRRVRRAYDEPPDDDEGAEEVSTPRVKDSLPR